MKHRGSSIVFFNPTAQILLMLRDDIPSIPYPGMWDLPGGHIEEHESPDECIRREMMEEMLIDTGSCDLFCIYDFHDRIEYVYTKPASFRADEIDLQEGQALEWFSESEISRMQLAYGFNRVLKDFFQRNICRKGASAN